MIYHAKSTAKKNESPIKSKRTLSIAQKPFLMVRMIILRLRLGVVGLAKSLPNPRLIMLATRAKRAPIAPPIVAKNSARRHSRMFA